MNFEEYLQKILIEVEKHPTQDSLKFFYAMDEFGREAISTSANSATRISAASEIAVKSLAFLKQLLEATKGEQVTIYRAHPTSNNLTVVEAFKRDGKFYNSLGTEMIVQDTDGPVHPYDNHNGTERYFQTAEDALSWQLRTLYAWSNYPEIGNLSSYITRIEKKFNEVKSGKCNYTVLSANKPGLIIKSGRYRPNINW